MYRSPDQWLSTWGPGTSRGDTQITTTHDCLGHEFIHLMWWNWTLGQNPITCQKKLWELLLSTTGHILNPAGTWTEKRTHGLVDMDCISTWTFGTGEVFFFFFKRTYEVHICVSIVLVGFAQRLAVTAGDDLVKELQSVLLVGDRRRGGFGSWYLRLQRERRENICLW